MKFSNDTSAFFTGKEVLLLEDNLLLAKQISSFLEKSGADVTHCQSLEEARRALPELSFDAALFDLNLPDGDSLELLREGIVPQNTSTVLMTGEGGIRSAVEAIQLGASDYLSKPFDLDELAYIFARADNRRKNVRLSQHNQEKEKKKTDDLFFKGAFAKDLEKLKKILDADRRLDSNLPPLLIDGPTGSGKSTYARWIHAHGPRSENSFVEVNCSAIPENLIESELFGHEKGAFTDAQNARIGLFEAADQGTLFLDEIASLSLAAQAKVLLAIENGVIRRVGGTKEIKVNIRIIAAANQDLRQMIQSREFREDLFHRLDLLRINIPELKTRGTDILPLANHFLTSLSNKYRLPVPKISKSSEAYIVRHEWTGNTRELIHDLERALVMAEKGQDLELSNDPESGLKNNILAAQNDWLNPSFVFPKDGFDLEKEMIRLIERAISQANGNISEAARLLGVPRDFIRYRLQKKGA
ncbi:MAG: sigma-54 dependent transcriptional regulator [Opitutales bacterium]|nr:sigma-54 dependent transcriptional regulator [Opitutales bacterium]